MKKKEKSRVKNQQTNKEKKQPNYNDGMFYRKQFP